MIVRRSREGLRIPALEIFPMVVSFRETAPLSLTTKVLEEMGVFETFFFGN
jgi:hypothetical protein